MNFLITLFLGPFKWWIVGGLVAAAAGLYVWRVHVERDYGRAEVQLKWDAAESRRKDQVIEAQLASDKETQRRLERAADAERKRNEAVYRSDVRVAGLLEQLRNRPERPAGGSAAAGNPTAGQACTGAGLYRPDGDFLIREAAAERDYCHDRYEALTK
jgi:hypothetical protein